MAQCTAHNRAGAQCGKPAMQGGNVCANHGGKAPQVLAAARIRLAALVDPAIGVLSDSMKNKKKLPQVALAAARDVLDRAGLKEPDKLEISGQVNLVEVLRERYKRRKEGEANDL